MKTALIGLCMLIVTANAGAAVVTRGPYLQSASADRITICWRTDVDTTSEVSFGLAAENLSSLVTQPGTRTEHAITLTGLQAATRYFYRAKGTPASGAPADAGGSAYWFRTAPSAGTSAPVRIWVVGDSGYLTNYADIAFANFMNSNAATGKPTDQFLLLGDNAYPVGTDSQYQNALFSRYSPLLRNTPLWSTIGNHDDATVPAVPPAPYYSIFNFPTAAECGGVASGTERYYSFNHGNIHFISIDANTYASVSDTPGNPYGMVDWLLDDLKACTADWIIAFMHEGPYSKGSHDSDNELNLELTRVHIVPLLESYGADLVLYGHSHNYERSKMIDGHYGKSNTWNAATMQKQPGNGSDLGGVDAAGSFVFGPSLAGGAYQKPAALGRSGTVYAVVGASSSAQGWTGGSGDLVNPSPHPAHIVSLTTIGSLVVEVDGLRLNAQYIDQSGAVRDDFTIIKGSTYQLLPPSPAFAGQANPGISFGVEREGAVAFADDVTFTTTPVSGGAITPTSGKLGFAAGTSEASVTFSPVSGQAGAGFQMQLETATRAVQTGAAQRAIYHISGPGTRDGAIEATPANTWYASRFGSLPASPSEWSQDADLDGMSLLMEYATGGEPNQLDPVPFGTVEGSTWVCRYRRASGRSDLNFAAMVSNDLSVWQPAGALDTNDGPSSLRGEPRRVTLPLTPPSGFVSLKAMLAP